jgi:hypothetical protein
VRIKPDLTLDEDFTTDFSEWTDGRYIHNFRYMNDGRALANVLHPEELDADFSRPYDPDVAERIGETGAHWKLWLFDLEAGTAAPVEGIDVGVGSGAQFAAIDGRTFIFAPYDDWGKTKVYEIDDDGVATERFEVAGDVFKWIRVR